MHPRARFHLSPLDILKCRDLRKTKISSAGKEALLILINLGEFDYRSVSKMMMTSTRKVWRVAREYRAGGIEAVAKINWQPGQRSKSAEVRAEVLRLGKLRNPRLTVRAIATKTSMHFSTVSRILGTRRDRRRRR